MNRKENRDKLYLIEKANKIKMLNLEIGFKCERLRKLKARLADGTVILGGMPSGRGGNGQLEKCVELMALAEEISADVETLAREQRTLADEIKIVGVPELCAVLQLRYVDGLRWQQIAQKLGYSLDGIPKVHNRALIAFGRCRADRERKNG